MRYTLLVAAITAALCCAQDTQVSQQSLHGTISNLDTEPAPYNPDHSLRFAASPRPTLQSERAASAPGPTLGAITDFQETYGLPVFGQGNFYDDFYPGYFGGGFYGPLRSVERPARRPLTHPTHSRAAAHADAEHGN